MRVRVGASSDVGRVRERNEDSYLAKGRLFAVADGMGGHQGGEVASRIAVETLSRARWDDDGSGLADAVRHANDAVLARASRDPEKLRGMGTTLTALVAGDDHVHLAHVGDSRAYLFRDGSLRLLTEDHTLVQRMVREGSLRPEEAEIHPQRSVLVRALGVESDLEVDEVSQEVRPGDRVLLCSDGLTGMVSESGVQRILAERDDPQDAADALVAAANEAGGMDNITAVVLDVLEDEAAAEPASGRPTVVSQPVAREAAPKDGPRRGRRLAVVLLAVVALLALAYVGTRAYVRSQWFVGVHEGRVALFRGLPTEVLGKDLFDVVEVTRLDAAEALRLRSWAGLDDGITAESEEEARTIIAQIEEDLGRRPPAPPGGGS